MAGEEHSERISAYKAAEILGIGKNGVYRLIRAGAISYRQLPGMKKVFFLKEDLDAYIARSAVPAEKDR